jgi:hypothetical protein
MAKNRRNRKEGVFFRVRRRTAKKPIEPIKKTLSEKGKIGNLMTNDFSASLKNKSAPRGRLRGVLLELLHALAGAQPHGGMRVNTK